MTPFRTLVSIMLAASMLSGCAVHNPRVWDAPQVTRPSPVRDRLVALPPPAQRVAIAVYSFSDQTGQFKPSESIQTLSRAVTQGATSILVKTLQDTGNRQWFTVIERERLDNVLRERAVIREMRASYLGEKALNPQALPPLLFAGILLEGGIIGYDSNTKTGGSGARFLGIGAMTQYREDTVTIYLRAVSTKTGEVLNSVSVRKSIQSVGIGGNAFKFVAFKDLLEIDAGITYNEPDQLALTQAIEKAVHSLIVEGALQDLWCFRADAETSTGLVSNYLAERENVKAASITLARRSDGSFANGACRSAPVAQMGQRPQPRPPLLVQPTPVAAPQRTSQPTGANAVPVKQEGGNGMK